jgi:hypothetical protein
MDCRTQSSFGVTAYDLDDALYLIKKEFFRDKPIPKLIAIAEDIDMSELLARNKHISRACSVWRGVWYPYHGFSGPVIGSVTNDW